MFSSADRAGDVLDRGSSADERYGGDVDPHTLDGPHRRESGSPKLARRTAKPRALGPRHALEGAHPRAGAPRSNLDDHDERPLARHDVELEGPQPEVPREDREAPGKEQVGHGPLGSSAELGPGQ